LFDNKWSYISLGMLVFGFFQAFLFDMEWVNEKLFPIDNEVKLFILLGRNNNLFTRRS